MIILTNRNLQPDHPPEERFGKSFNSKGPDELRVAEAKKDQGQWIVNILPDVIKEKKNEEITAGEQTFLKIQKYMKASKRDCVFLVHGFNVNFNDALETAYTIEHYYDVEVVLFTWPANGRDDSVRFAKLSGLTSYKSDKRDALRSVEALDRVFEKLNKFFNKYDEETMACQRRVTLMLHSMGNYLFKHLMKSSVYQGETSLFDNVILVSADVNNMDHSLWVDRISYRRRLYITINENDYALQASRLKFGAKQLARLGHFSQNLTSQRAVYLDFTEAEHVGSSHAYFDGATVEKNAQVYEIFQRILHGKKVEGLLDYNPQSRAYMVY